LFANDVKDEIFAEASETDAVNVVPINAPLMFPCDLANVATPRERNCTVVGADISA
jgi:hypothetical protein